MFQVTTVLCSQYSNIHGDLYMMVWMLERKLYGGFGLKVVTWREHCQVFS